MKNARDQDIATGIISLGLLANKMALFLSAQQFIKINETALFDQWKKVLKETIDFIKAPETVTADNQAVGIHFLSRAQYLEQIYTATPEINKKDLKTLAEYLQTIYNTIVSLSEKKSIDTQKRDMLIAFTRSIADESILEASRFHQEIHTKRKSESVAEVMAYD